MTSFLLGIFIITYAEGFVKRKMASFEKRGEKWSVRFRIMAPGGEVNKRLSGFRTKAEANKAMIDYLAEHPSEDKEFDGINTFADLCALWLENLRSRSKESTYLDAKSRTEQRILPFFAKKKLKDITPATILEWQRTLEGYKFSTRKTLRTVLASIFKFGERYYDIPNVMNKVEPLRNLEGKKEMLFWTYEEFSAFIECVDEKYKPFFNFLYVTGCRKGEALALAPSDIDFKARRASITKSLTNKTSKRGYAITTTKNEASVRSVDLPEWLLRDIAVTDPRGSFLFGGDDPFSTTQIDRVFAAACTRAGVKKIRIHDLRHSCASFLISQGISIVAVSKRLGHSDTQQTLNTYSHMMPKDEERIVALYEHIGGK